MVEIHWEGSIPEADCHAVVEALTHERLVEETLAHLAVDEVASLDPPRLTVRYLATGGAKRVYLVRVHSQRGDPFPFVLKHFLARQLAYLPPGATLGGLPAGAPGLDDRLLERMVWAARRVDERAPGLCARFGGLWIWAGDNGFPQRWMTEAYLAGDSLDAWKAGLEDRFVRGELDFSRYLAMRTAMERRAMAAYIRLWDVLGRETFTSDPSPWNVLFVPTDVGYDPAIIDLHSIHDSGTPVYVFQILEELFGSRDELREHALCPAIFDALGVTEGKEFLQTVCVQLEAQADQRFRSGLSSYAASCRAIRRFLSQQA